MRAETAPAHDAGQSPNFGSGEIKTPTPQTGVLESVVKTADNTNVDPPPFSIFSRGEKRWISSLASFGAMFSTLSSYIYFPALVPMAHDFDVSVTLINLTVTCYLVVAGIAP